LQLACEKLHAIPTVACSVAAVACSVAACVREVASETNRRRELAFTSQFACFTSTKVQILTPDVATS